MKKAILFLIFALISVGFIQAQQDIFKKYGHKKEMLTLSKGKYQEVFKNEEVVQIGTVLLNTKTNRVIKLLQEDTTKTNYNAELSSRFLTIDPLAEKYYSISPYAFCANNPVNRIDPDGMDWYSFQEEYKDENGKTQTRTAYKYVEGQMSKKEVKQGGYTHLGLTYTNGNNYYSLFGEKKDLKTTEGQAYQKIDNAIIQYAEFVEESKHPSYNYGEERGMPATDFSMNNNNSFNVQYGNSTWGVVRLNKSESNNAYMLEWIGNSDQPKSISGWNDSNTKYYHILLRSKRGDRDRDIVHLKYNQANAMKLLKTYYNLFPNLKPKLK